MSIEQVACSFRPEEFLRNCPGGEDFLPAQRLQEKRGIARLSKESKEDMGDPTRRWQKEKGHCGRSN